MKLKLSNLALTTLTDQAGRPCLAALATDNFGRVWVNPDLLGEADWQEVSNKAKPDRRNTVISDGDELA